MFCHRCKTDLAHIIFFNIGNGLFHLQAVLICSCLSAGFRGKHDLEGMEQMLFQFFLADGISHKICTFHKLVVGGSRNLRKLIFQFYQQVDRILNDFVRNYMLLSASVQQFFDMFFGTGETFCGRQCQDSGGQLSISQFRDGSGNGDIMGIHGS